MGVVVGRAILGPGAGLIVIEDPIKAGDVASQAERRRIDDIFDNTMYTHLDDKRTGAIVSIWQWVANSALGPGALQCSSS